MRPRRDNRDHLIFTNCCSEGPGTRWGEFFDRLIASTDSMGASGGVGSASAQQVGTRLTAASQIVWWLSLLPECNKIEVSLVSLELSLIIFDFALTTEQRQKSISR
jgi:hypothetical protein